MFGVVCVCVRARENAVGIQTQVIHSHFFNTLVAPLAYAQVMALGNLAMDAPGRKGMLEVFTVLEDLTQLLAADDMECRRSTCLTLGNLLIEEEARDNLLSIPMSVRALSDQLKCRDLFLVRYIPRTCVHVCMCMCMCMCMCVCVCVCMCMCAPDHIT